MRCDKWNVDSLSGIYYCLRQNMYIVDENAATTKKTARKRTLKKWNLLFLIDLLFPLLFFSSREHRTFTTNSFTHSFLHTSTWHNAMKSIAIHSALCYVILIYYLFHFLYSLKYTKCMQTIHGNPDWIRIFAPCLHS